MSVSAHLSVQQLASGAAVIVAATLVVPTYAAFVTSGVYDENTVQSNTVDVSATSDGTNTLSLGSFSTLVAPAFADNRGGVIDFDNGTLAGPNTIEATYGVSQSRTITITNQTTHDLEHGSNTFSTPISGASTTAELSKDGPGSTFSTWNDFSFGFDPADKVTAVGATILNNFAVLGTPVGNVGGNVRYTDGSSASTVFSFVSTSSGPGADDTFWGFRAPPGEFIDRFNLTIGNDVFVALDDLAFITIPEPSAALLMILGMGTVLLRRLL